MLMLLAAALTVAYDAADRPVAFAVSEIRSARSARGDTVIEVPLDAKADIVIAAGAAQTAAVVRALAVAPAGKSEPQSYAVRRKGNTVVVLGHDSTGAMYGGLDVAEAIRLNTLAELRDADRSPHIEHRGIKFNIPLDVRTPSYTDNSDAAQKNIPEMWSLDFWREFLDEMARHRFDTLSLWNLHPFPSIVRVPEFPEVALNDVLRTRVPLDDTYSHSGNDMFRPELMNRVETVRTMTMDQKIAFWRDVMQYAKDRGIDVYWFTWNMFVFGADGKHGITPAQDNPTTIAYFRASVRETVLTYPLLAGIGITAGERMQERTDEFAKEKWLWAAYGEGIRDAKKVQPHRDFRLIHRYHQTAQSEITDAFREYPGTLDLSFKYSIAHMYSIPNPPFLAPALPYLNPKLRTWLTVRDDDYYSFRWGSPAYAREYIRNIPGRDKIAGFYMGPDGYIWGREFLSRDPQTPRELVIRKRWYGFMLWGRLAYDPETPDALFERHLAVRFPEVDAAALSRAWAEASMIFPTMTRFLWGDIDLRWHPEYNLSHPRHKGFYTVKDYVEGGTMPGSGVLNIVEWRQGRQDGTTPLQIADALAGQAALALKTAAAMHAKAGGNRELRETLGDMTAMAHLGNYYAEKIRGACELAQFDKSGKVENRAAALKHLQAALDHWKRYATAYTLQYEQPKLYNRVGWVDVHALTAKAEHDLAIARLWTPGTVPDAAPPRQADRPFRK